MIRPLRHSHLRAWCVLAPFLAVVLVLAASARRDATPVNPGVRWERLP